MYGGIKSEAKSKGVHREVQGQCIILPPQSGIIGADRFFGRGIMEPKAARKPIIDYFSEVKDPRTNRNKLRKYPLVEGKRNHAIGGDKFGQRLGGRGRGLKVRKVRLSGTGTRSGNGVKSFFRWSTVYPNMTCTGWCSSH
jgi:hypothetical protein